MEGGTEDQNESGAYATGPFILLEVVKIRIQQVKAWVRDWRQNEADPQQTVQGVLGS